jgi:L-threonylcarbamoyladenylate synthase
MVVLQIDPANIDDRAIAQAAAIIKRGGLVAFPTETVYGLGADATSTTAVAAIFTAKGRPSYNPLIVHAADVTDAARYVTVWPDKAQTLAYLFWPGPLTLVLPRGASIPDIVTAGLPTVGIRVPNHPVATALIRAAGVPLAAPSANRSMHISPTSGAHVAASLGAAPDLILDAGPASVGIESTVLDLTSRVPTILRPGMISIEQLRGVLGEVEIAGHTPTGDAARPSPGMMDRHYSPLARLRVVPEGLDAVTGAALAERDGGARLVVLARAPVAPDAFTVWRMPDVAAEYARMLYASLHRADGEGYDTILVEAVPGDSSWDGVRDRLRRAAR